MKRNKTLTLQIKKKAKSASQLEDTKEEGGHTTLIIEKIDDEHKLDYWQKLAIKKKKQEDAKKEKFRNGRTRSRDRDQTKEEIELEKLLNMGVKPISKDG